MQKLAQLEKKRERYKQWSALNSVKTDLVPNQKKPPISAKHEKKPNSEIEFNLATITFARDS